MKILVYGAGVLGSVYAARLQANGHQVKILARGERLAQIREHGVVLCKSSCSTLSVTRVETVEAFTPEDDYDLVIVLVRKNQVNDILPILAANQRVPSFLFMVNNASGPAEYIRAVGRERVLLGFPGAGGTRKDHIVHYEIVNPLIQTTTIGELSGVETKRIDQIAEAFREAGFPTDISKNMDAWNKTHVALVSPIANAIYAAEGSNYRLAKTQDALILMVRSIQESLALLKKIGVPLTPFKFRVLPYLPEPLLVAGMKWALDSRWAELVITRHANAARDEMQALADEFRALNTIQMPMPATDQLYSFIRPTEESIPLNSHSLQINWDGLVRFLLGLGLSLFALRGIGKNLRRKRK